MNNRQWMEIHINTLFQCDPDGRLRCVNEPGNPPAPRFYMGRTNEGNRWRFRYDLPADLVTQLEALCQSEAITADLEALPQNYAAIKAVLAAAAPLESEYRGPAYWIPERVTASPAAVLLDEAAIKVAQPHFPWLTSADPYYAMGPVAAVMVDGRAVSLCFCSRCPGHRSRIGNDCRSPGQRVCRCNRSNLGGGCSPTKVSTHVQHGMDESRFPAGSGKTGVSLLR
jgi:hypothetical protein